MATPLTNSRLPVKGIIFDTVGTFSLQTDYAGYVVGTDSSGYLPSVLIPTGFIVLSHTVADQTARLALSAKIGDIAVQSDNSLSYILTATPATIDGNWAQLCPNSITRNTSGALTLAATGSNQNVTVTPSGTGNLVLSSGKFSGNGGLITGLNASNISSGTIASTYLPAFTGDATASAGSTALTLATISPAVTGPYKTVNVDGKGRVTGGTLVATTISLTTLGITNGSVLDSWGGKTVPAGIVADLTSTQTFTGKTIDLASNTITGVLPSASTPTLSGDVTNVLGAVTIGTGAVTLAKMANIAGLSIVGNNGTGTGTPSALNATQVKAILAIQTSDVASLDTYLGNKAPTASPTFTGTVTLPTLAALTVTALSTGTSGITLGDSTYMLRSSVALPTVSGSSTPTLGAAGPAGTPTKWIPINDNGTTRYIPAW